MSHELVIRIHRALEAATPVVHGITADQWTLPTPCDGWDVLTLADHLVGGIGVFADLVTGGHAEHDPDVDWLGDDPAGAFDRVAQLDRAAWSADGALARPVRLSFGALPGPMAAVVHLTELVVHAVDLAVATDQVALVDDAQAAELLASMDAMGGIDAFRVPGMFGAEVPCPEGAPAHLRLLAYVGRQLVLV